MNRASSQLVNCLFKIPEVRSAEWKATRKAAMSGGEVPDVKVAAHATG